jgi:twinkle protein
MYYEQLSDLGIKLTRRSGQEKTLCPECSATRKNKKDKCLSVNITTGEYRCHNCDFKGNVRISERRRENINYAKVAKEYYGQAYKSDKMLSWFQGRGISEATVNKFMIYMKEEWMPQTQAKERCICFPYFRDAEIVNIKFRDGRKNFKMVSKAELILYNLNSIRDRKKAILVEGEPDCLSVYECGYSHEDMEDVEVSKDEKGDPITKRQYTHKSSYGVLSVPNGASKGAAALEYIDNCSDWLFALEEVIIATDGDAAGRQLKDELVRRIGVEKCRVLQYPSEKCVPTKDGEAREPKDLNEVLMYMGKDWVDWCIENAAFIPVEGVHMVEDIFETMLDNFRKGIQLAPTTRYPTIDPYFRWKKGEVILHTGYMNCGKTFNVLQLMLTKSIWDDWKWGIFSPENYPANDFYDDLVEMYAGKWIDKMTESEYIDACWFINQHIFFVYPENEQDLNCIHDRFRYLVLKKGIDGVLIDPWNQLDSLQKPYQREDQYLSEMLKVVKRFALMNNVVYNIIAHPKNATPNQDRSLPVVDFHDISGGAMWGNKVDGIVSWYRPNWHNDKKDPHVEMHIQKVKRKRTGGQHGHIELYVTWANKRLCEKPDLHEPCDPQKFLGKGSDYDNYDVIKTELTFDDSKMKQISERLYEPDEIDPKDWGDQPF